MERLRERWPQVRFAGIGGPKMQAVGMDAWWDAEELAVMGLFEVLSHFPRLLKLRRELFRRLCALSPDVFIGIDAPDFNLGLEIQLRRRGLKTVHYVSPTVWAWRKRRVRKIARAVDRVLCLFPFEPEFYHGHGVKAVYVGHPMADRIRPDDDPRSAREWLGLDPDATTVSLLPGSRLGEVTRLAEPMIEAARLLHEQTPGLQFVAALAKQTVRNEFRDTMRRLNFESIHCVDGESLTVMAAADAVICASGTATLETMLVNRPLVSTYRISPATYNTLKYTRLMKPGLYALPNVLAGEELIPERIQSEATPENLAAETRRWLEDGEARERLRRRFLELHEQLRCDAAGRAADAVAELIDSGSTR